MLSYTEFLRRVPKAELHCHLGGAIRATTLGDLAKKNGFALPRPAERIYEFGNFYEFLDIFRLVALALKTPDDFARVTWEAIEDGVTSGNRRHVEFFFNPDYYYPNGIRYGGMLDGILAGAAAGQRDFGASTLVIPSIDRQVMTPAQAVEMVEIVLADRRDGVVGIGLDGAERAGPPQTFSQAYALAGKGGLKRTAHVCEDNQTLTEAPPSNYLACRDLLHCDRLDHGYNVLADDAVVAQARDDGLYFTGCTISRLPGNFEARQQRIRRMHALGLRMTLNTDDPTIFGTNIGHGWLTLFAALGWGPDLARDMSLNGIDASWLDPGEKAAWRRRFEQEIETLLSDLDPADRSVQPEVALSTPLVFRSRRATQRP